MTYALISEGVVENLISIHAMNVHAFPNAVPTGGLPVSIGDTYVDGVFYHYGIEVTPPSTLESENADLKEALALLGVTMDE